MGEGQWQRLEKEVGKGRSGGGWEGGGGGGGGGGVAKHSLRQAARSLE